MSAAPAITSSAIKRLNRDLIELNKTKSPLFGAVPFKGDLFCWHCNLFPQTGPYAGDVFHVTLEFPPNYPNSAPLLRMRTPLYGHPNVFHNGDHICLDMLRERSPYDSQAYSAAWSTAYSASSILLQVYSFLFSDTIPQEYGDSGRLDDSRHQVAKTKAVCKELKCMCGHGNISADQGSVVIHPLPSAAIAPNGSAAVPVSVTKEPDIVSSDDQGCTCFNQPCVSADRPAVFACQTLESKWKTAYSSRGLSKGSACFEIKMSWQGGHWSREDISGAVCRVGLGTNRAAEVGTSGQPSFGYGSTGKFSYNGQFDDFGGRARPYTGGDRVLCVLDKDHCLAIFYVNGKELEPPFNFARMPDLSARGDAMFPMVTFKNCRVEFDFHPNVGVGSIYPADSIAAKTRTWAQATDMLQLLKPPSLSASRAAEAAMALDGDGEEKKDTLVEKKSALEVLREATAPQCFHTKLRALEDGAILGMGLTVDYAEGQTYSVGVMPRIKSTQLCFDLLSKTAYDNDKVRRGVWGKLFRDFLPVMLTKEHALLAVGDVSKLMARLAFVGRDPSKDELKRVDISEFVLDMMASLMNTVVVSIAMSPEATAAQSDDVKMDDDSARMRARARRFDSELDQMRESGEISTPARGSGIPLFMSEKALNGYCQLYHTLLVMCHFFPKMLEIAQKQVNDFNRIPDRRHKRYTPDLGKLLVALTLAGFKPKPAARAAAPAARKPEAIDEIGRGMVIGVAETDLAPGDDIEVRFGGGMPVVRKVEKKESKFGEDWTVMANDFVTELLARNVYWAVSKDTELGNKHLGVSQRINKSFVASLTGFRLVMFQLRFIQFTQELRQGTDGTLQAVVDRLYQTYGQPHPTQQKQLHADCKAILAVKSFKEFYPQIGLACPADADLFRRLETAMNFATKVNYYTPGGGARGGGRGRRGR
jgi:ubiquitin-protein ligase